MTKERIFRGLAILVVAFIGVAVVTALARRESKESSPMEDLSSTEQLKQRFQQDSGKVRLIALVSPVCPECRRGFADMQNVLKEIPDNRLRAYIVWLPMFPSDSRGWAQTRSDEFKDERLSYYWDGGKVTGEEWAKTLGINRTAWDVYFLYGSESKWEGATPAPSFWMHQLGGVTKAPHLNKEEFKNKVKELLASVK
ncbi:MAG: hypothetical protein M3410_12605 [Acidobacteriota bacterium]|nr:hypothetical protein [Acidobacteriota bacterium]